MKDVAIVCTFALAPWGPESLNEGIGGSEEAVIYLSRELQKLGHNVFVYGKDVTEGNDQGVIWRDIESFGIVSHDVAIAWRSAETAYTYRNLPIGKWYLWLHDMSSPEDQIFGLCAHHLFYEKYLTLSKFHNESIHFVPKEKLYQTSNGVSVAISGSDRAPYQMVYASNYDRGLKSLLESWTAIKSQIPEAKLKVCYGWDTLEKLHVKRGEKEQFLALKEHIEHLFNQEGIEHLGRVSHEKLHKLMEESDVLAYPCSYPETSCIVAMKAQALGAIPAVVASGALKETVQYGFKQAPETDEDGITMQCAREWTEGLVKLLKDPKKDRIRERMQTYATTLTWENVAKDWSTNLLS